MKMIRKTTGYFKSFDGTRIYYETKGEGPPLVFVYGIGCLMNHWRPQIKYFSESFQTIILDYRAHHKSDIPKDPHSLSIDSLAKDLHELMRHLEITKASFWGHSFGVQILTAAYKMNPEIFENLIFINGFVINPIEGMFGNNLADKAFRIIKTTHKMLPDTLSYIWKKSINNPIPMYLSAIVGGFNLQLTHLKDIEIYARGIASIDIQSFLCLFEDMMNYNGEDMLSEIHCPTLIMAGEKDSVTPLKHQRHIHDKISNSELFMVPLGSHCTQLDMPDLINLRAEKFLKKSSLKVTADSKTPTPSIQ